MATFPKTQKPIAAAGSAWWPGGRTRAKPPCSTAPIAAPAASRAASSVDGVKIVSASSRPLSPLAASARNRATYRPSWHASTSASVAGRA
jgi:hypothetical protein